MDKSVLAWPSQWRSVLSSFPRNFLVTPVFLESSNPSSHVRASSGKTKVSLLQRALSSSASLPSFRDPLSRVFPPQEDQPVVPSFSILPSSSIYVALWTLPKYLKIFGPQLHTEPPSRFFVRPRKHFISGGVASTGYKTSRVRFFLEASHP